MMNKTHRYKSTSDVRAVDLKTTNYALGQPDYKEPDFDSNNDIYNFKDLEVINNLLDSSNCDKNSSSDEDYEASFKTPPQITPSNVENYGNKETYNQYGTGTKNKKVNFENLDHQGSPVKKEQMIQPIAAKSSTQINSNYFISEVNNNLIAIEKAESLADLKVLKSHTFVQLINNQKCSRLLQERLTTFTSEFDFLIDEINFEFGLIMVNQYGNYFCQRLVETCDFAQRCKILSYTTNYFKKICFDQFGSHVVQKVIECCYTVEEANALMKNLKGHEIDIAQNKRGYHILVKLIHFVPEHLRVTLNRLILINIKKLCTNLHGVCVVKKLVSSAEHYGLIGALKAELAKHAVELVQDSHGIFIFLHLLDVWKYQGARECFLPILGNVAELCMKKYSESIVALVLPMLSVAERKSIQAKLLSVGTITSLLKNKYGVKTLKEILVIMEAQECYQVKRYLQQIYQTIGDEEKLVLKEIIMGLA